MRQWLLVGCGLATIVNAQVAHAQSTDMTSSVKKTLGASTLDDSSVSEIVVTGFRSSTRSTIKDKRRNTRILDSVSQDDIAQLPDLNVVEAARRIPGISAVSGADPTKNRDLYQQVTIRGLDSRYNLTTVDGVQVASADQSTRGARLDLLPSTLVSQVQVVKTLTARDDPHGLGGQVNLVTQSAFAINKPLYFVAEALVGRNSTAGELIAGDTVSVRANATAAALIGSDWGVVASVEYQRLPSTSNAEIYGTDGGFWSYLTPSATRTPFQNLSSTGFVAPTSAQGYRFDNMRARASANLKLEWRPSERTNITAFGGFYYLDDLENRYEFLTRPATSGRGATPDNAGASPASPVAPTATSGQFALGDIQQGISNQPTRRETFLLSLRGEFELNPDWQLSVLGSDSKATYREEWNMVKYDTAPRPGVPSANFFVAQSGYSYTIVDGRPRLAFNQPAIVADPTRYRDMYWRDIDRNLDQRVSFARAELGYRRNGNESGLNALVGVTATRTTQKWDIVFNERVPATAAAQEVIGDLTRVMEPKTFANLATPGTPYFLVNLARANALFETMTNQFVTTDQTANNYQDDYRDAEMTYGMYGEIGWRKERFSLLAGLRYDTTRLTVDAYSRPTEAGVTGYVPTTRHGQYGFALPSLLASYDLTDDFRIRAGVGKTIGRPDFSQYAARTSYTVGSDGSLTINTGNPDLAPRETWNYDLSAEWYHGNSLISVALFAKDLKNEIFTASMDGPATTYLGKNYTVVHVSSPLNAHSGYVHGIELSLIQDHLPFLLGLGVSANLTLLEGGFDLPSSPAAIAVGAAPTRRTSGLINQPEYVGNVTLFYSNPKLDAHVSYNRIGRAAQAVNQDVAWRDLYQQAREQIDLQMRYHLTPSASFVLEVQNLTKSPFVVRQGYHDELLNNYFNVGRTIWFGATWRFGAK